MQSGATANAYLYTGQQFDALTGLYYLRARYYAPSDGRFLSRDPAEIALFDPRELNRYVYTADNPVNASAPSGLTALTEYSMANKESREESTAAEPVGQTTADLYAREVASQQIQPAMSLRTQFFNPREPVVIAKGVYSVNGEARTFVTVNNFYTKEVYEANKLAVEALQREAFEKGWEFEGGIFQEGATRETALHAEQNVLKLVERLGLGPNSRVSVGVSRGLCWERCMLLGEKTYVEGARGVIVHLANNIRVIIMGKP